MRTSATTAATSTARSSSPTGTFASRSAVSAGGAVGGAGGELRQRLLEDAGERLEAAMDYLVPTAVEVPAFVLDHLEIPSPTTVGGVKGVGEGGTVGAPAAVANAVCNALGVELNELPLTPERLREDAQRRLA